MVTEDLMRKYKYGYVHSCKLLEEPFIKDLLKENQELKKQLEEKQNPFKGIFAQVNDDTLLRDCGNMNAEINELKNQQKEFIEYLEDESKEIYRDGGLRQNIFRQILQKYKEIIGVSDENNKQ